jgi:hypothetical protein
VPYNPQQNGVAKINNMTICEATKAMMYDSNLPLSLWVEDTSTTVYIQNTFPHKSLEEKTTEKVITGKKPSIDHLITFCSPVYIHVPKEKRTKLEPLGKKGTFVGYSETSKSYRIYVPGKNYIEVSRDVTFHEEATFHHCREISYDTEEDEAPSTEPSNSQLSDEQREEAREPSMEPIRDSIEFPLDKPPTKKKPSWCHEILKEEEKHATPKGNFRESKKLDKYSGLIAQLNIVIDSKPSTFDKAIKHKCGRMP